jgi:HD superfamily phosphodiesterase
VAACARGIAGALNLDVEKAGRLGLLHDIGRRYGVSDGRHTLDGYRYLTQIGEAEGARICLTHSLPVQDVGCYSGRWDITPEELEWLKTHLAGITYDDYDRLIQLCDSLAMADGTIDLKARMDDIEVRHGFYPLSKRQAHYRLKEYFDKMAGFDLYTVLRSDQ